MRNAILALCAMVVALVLGSTTAHAARYVDVPGGQSYVVITKGGEGASSAYAEMKRHGHKIPKWSVIYRKYKGKVVKLNDRFYVPVPTKDTKQVTAVQPAKPEPTRVARNAQVVEKAKAEPACNATCELNNAHYELALQWKAERLARGSIEPGASVDERRAYVRTVLASWAATCTEYQVSGLHRQAGLLAVVDEDLVQSACGREAYRSGTNRAREKVITQLGVGQHDPPQQVPAETPPHNDA